jgi:hypothetical protein
MEVADYFDDEHVAVISSVYLEGLAIACFVFFIGGAATVVRQAGEAGSPRQRSLRGQSSPVSWALQASFLRRWLTGRLMMDRSRRACSTSPC